MRELPTEEKEDYLSRAILLMHAQPMVGIVMEMEVFFTTEYLRRRGRKVVVVLSITEPFSVSKTSKPYRFCDQHNQLASLRTSYFCNENYFAVISVIYDISLHCTDLLF